MFIYPHFNQVLRTAVFLLAPQWVKKKWEAETHSLTWELALHSWDVCDRIFLPAGTSASYSELHFTFFANFLTSHNLSYIPNFLLMNAGISESS